MSEPGFTGFNGPTQGRRVSDSVVAKLAALLMEAKRGNIGAIAVINVSPEGEPKVDWAGDADLVASANLGLDILKATLMSRIVGLPGAAVMNSGIVRPGG